MFSLILAPLIHELGHYLTAMYLGHTLEFRRQGFRLIWDMPNDTPQHQRLIALSGYGAEILAAPLLYFAGLWLYPWVVAVHLMAYPFYAGEYSDFRWFLNGFAGISARGWTWIYVMVMCAAFWYGIYRLLMFIW